jgi:hypothetical protein
VKPNDENGKRPTSVRMGLGRAPKGSPRRQHELGLNRDATLAPKKGEGERLRE